ncbi:dolichyl-diphosphooligosaccharide-protein glycotransferase [Tieghemostelium lacteum]|uniref:Dolichyl-diphosphooligosaccharide-protein glycotransferase n=1 Tax=Tieghemostelium lacteum TaxID=361077 RepID=A0A151Z9L3_TIELA|nr:dolichyl-diphosphooligosaccharide-protein glycotransferase [Tieghemostelium lacteum]|eukprot:KYQ90638.1 dolichyl-diphosphooligosaccharide-protein glycotransferase [Tieghemostelium lacteum]
MKNLIFTLVLLVVLSSIGIINAQTGGGLASEFEKLAKLNNGLTNLNTQLAKKYLNAASRPYDIFALFTSSDPKHGCQVCGTAKNQMEIFRDNYLEYLNSPAFQSKPLFLVIVEVSSGMEVFQQLNMQTIPHLIFFPSGSQPISIKDKLDMFDPHIISNFIKQRTGIHIEIKKTWFEENSMIIYSVAILLASIKAILVIWRFRKNTMFWYFASMILFSLVIGGIFYDFIHKPPVMEFNPYTRESHYFSRGPRTQTVAEGLIMGSLTVLTSFIFVYLARLPDSNYTDTKAKSLGTFAIVTFILLLLILSSGFQIKYYRPWFYYPAI